MVEVVHIAPSLKLGTDGIWRTESSEEVSYPSDGNETCFAIEDDSFWFRHRSACIVAAVETFPPRARGPIFDIGGGNGYVSASLIKAGFDVVLVEPGPMGAINAKKRGVPVVIQAATRSAGFEPNSLDSVGLFDVVEHIEEDVEFLTSIRALMKPETRLYVTVPAYSALWSYEDELAGHFRRYTRASLVRTLLRAGFKEDYATYIFRPLPLPILLFRTIPSRLGRRRSAVDVQSARADHKPAGSAAMNVVNWLLRSEVENIRVRRPMSFGGSCLVVASTI
jgi:SAM-dependent methyltransferase